jgi:hypothetical protein
MFFVVKDLYFMFSPARTFRRAQKDSFMMHKVSIKNHSFLVKDLFIYLYKISFGVRLCEEKKPEDEVKLDEYVYENEINVTAFAKTNNVSATSLFTFMAGSHSPHLITALKLEIITGGDVRCCDLLSDADIEKIESWGKAIKL